VTEDERAALYRAQQRARERDRRARARALAGDRDAAARVRRAWEPVRRPLDPGADAGGGTVANPAVEQ
jgi:hypothetical protein